MRSPMFPRACFILPNMSFVMPPAPPADACCWGCPAAPAADALASACCCCWPPRLNMPPNTPFFSPSACGWAPCSSLLTLSLSAILSNMLRPPCFILPISPAPPSLPRRLCGCWGPGEDSPAAGATAPAAAALVPPPLLPVLVSGSDIGMRSSVRSPGRSALQMGDRW